MDTIRIAISCLSNLQVMKIALPSWKVGDHGTPMTGHPSNVSLE